MDTPGLKDRLGNVGNQFAITSLLAFAMSIPLFVIREGSKWGAFCDLYKTNPIVSFNLIASGLYWYGYNELATMTIKKVRSETRRAEKARFRDSGFSMSTLQCVRSPANPSIISCSSLCSS